MAEHVQCRYKRRLHALWASLNSSTAVPALREKVLQGTTHVACSDCVCHTMLSSIAVKFSLSIVLDCF